MKYLIDYNMNANHHSIQQVESIDHLAKQDIVIANAKYR